MIIKYFIIKYFILFSSNQYKIKCSYKFNKNKFFQIREIIEIQF